MVGTSYCAKDGMTEEEIEEFVKNFGEKSNIYCIRCPNGCC